MTTFELLQQAKSAKTAMTLASTDTKNAALLAMADALVENQQAILAANALDLEAAKICLDSGCAMVIANGNAPENLYDILDGKPIGTLFGEVTL